mmetsp:Transcript_8673/g.17171  ORF Transcript_8673/g.17171 Transcript_8673/m.17171 type:complete len:240 (+) Transcript_8673:422-1141(+)
MELRLLQRLKDNDVIKAVEKLRAEVSSHITHDVLLSLLHSRIATSVVVFGVRVSLRAMCDLAAFDHLFSSSFDQILATNIGGHDDDCVTEVHQSTLTISKATIVKHLKQHIENITVRLFNLIKKNHSVRTALYSFCKLATFFVTHIAWSSTNQARNRVLLHVLRHVNTNHAIRVIKELLSKSFDRLSLTYTSGSQEEKTGNRAGFRGQTGTCTNDTVCYSIDCRVLTNDALLEACSKAE